MISSILLALLLSLGVISSENDFHDLTPDEITNYEIIIVDNDIH